MKSLIVAVLIAVSGCTGCKNDASADTDGNVRYLVVGMERSQRFGDCPGCELDANRISSLLAKKFGYIGDTLISSNATKKAVVAKLRAGIASTPANGMFIFCYSGHGGQEYLGGTEPDGSDRQDEYLCLYDTYMLDDEIWDVVSKCKGRVFLYFDACHSATMYRSVAQDIIPVKKNMARTLQASNLVKSSGFFFDIQNKIPASTMSVEAKDLASLRMLCWSGCKEIEYSYGSSYGGVMTNALVKRWVKGITYANLWKNIVSDVQSKQPTQHPVATSLGVSFDNVEAFK